MASLNVSPDLPYQPAVGGRMAAPRVSINPCIQIVTRENRWWDRPAPRQASASARLCEMAGRAAPLAAHGFAVTVAGRTLWEESEAALRAGFRSLFAGLGIPVDADDPACLVLFPEMEAEADVPEITERCWGILGKSPLSVMCATSRMVVKRKGAARPAVVSCTLLPYEDGFEMGASLAEAARPVKLNHRHCARFCVLGGASCSPNGGTG